MGLSGKRAFSLVEVLLASALLSLLSLSIIKGLMAGEEGTAVASKREAAVRLADEGWQATRSIRDVAFVNLADGVYELALNSGQWQLAASGYATTGFSRKITVSTIDAQVKQIDSTVTWEQTGQRSGSVTVTGYLSNWRRTTAVASWASPQIVGQLDLTGALAGQRIAVCGNYAYIIRSPGVSDFRVVDISNQAVPVEVASFNVTDTATGVACSGNHVFLSDANNGQEVIVINVTNPLSPAFAGNLNLPGTADANAIVITGNYALVARNASGDNEINVIDITNPAAPTFAGGLNLTQNAKDIALQGSYLYVASPDDSQEVKVVSLATITAPVQVASFNATGVADGWSISALGNIVALGQVGGMVTLVDVTTPTAPVQLGTYAADATVNQSWLTSDKLFLVKSTGTAEFQVLNISTPTVPVVLGAYDTPNSLNGIYYDSTRDIAITVGANTSEVIIFEPS